MSDGDALFKAESATGPMPLPLSPRALVHFLIYLYLIVLDLPCLPVGHELLYGVLSREKALFAL